VRQVLKTPFQNYDRERREDQIEISYLQSRLESLTTREREVLDMVVTGILWTYNVVRRSKTTLAASHRPNPARFSMIRHFVLSMM